MTIGKEIKVVMTLDDSGFKYKIDGVKSGVKSLELGLGDFTKAANRVETSVFDLGKNLDKFGASFDSMQRGLQSTIDKLQSTVNSFKAVDVAQKESVKVAKDSVTAMIDAKKKALENEVEMNRRLLEQRGKLHAELRKLESDQRAQSMMAMMQAEKAERGKKAGARTLVDGYLNEADNLERSANAIRQEINAIDKWVMATRQEQALRLSNIQSLEKEREAVIRDAQAKETLAKIAAAVSRNNNAEIERIRKGALRAQQDADMSAAKSAEDLQRLKKQYAEQEVRDRREAERQIRNEANETALAQRRAMREAAEEQRRQAQMVAQMWTGMAQMYAGAKINQGLKSSVSGAADMETARVSVSALNLPGQEERDLFSSAEALSKQLKFISNLDAIQAKMSAISSLGYNNVKVIDETLASAIKATNNLQMLGYGHGDMQSSLRNIYGVAEMRQQTAHPEDMLKTFEVLQRSVAATAGKVQVSDIETVLRKVGGGASTLSDDGLINLVGLIDQFKVSGGDGSGGGVATVGTIIKMMQAYATGKGKSNNAVKEFAGAGILDSKGLDLSQDSAGILRDAKNGNFKNVDLWLKDPISAIQQMVPQIVAYTKQEGQRAKFYQDGNVNDEKAQMLAVAQYLQRLGITQTAVQAVMAVGSPEAAARINHQSDTIKNSKGIDQVDSELAKTYSRNLQEVSKELDNLKVSVGNTLLPILKDVLSVIGSIVKSASEFAKNNPISTQFLAIGAAAAGLMLTLKGMLGLFGLFGPATAIIRNVGGAMFGLSGATATAGTAAASSGRGWVGLTGYLNNTWASVKAGATTHMPAMHASILGMAGAVSGGGSAGSRIALGFSSLATGVTAMAKTVSGAFLRMIPLVGQLLLAWDLTQLVANLEVGGVSVITWVIGFGDRLLTMFKNIWINIKSLFASESEKVALMAEKARNNAELKSRLKANGMGGDEPRSLDEMSWEERHALTVENDRDQAAAEAAKNAPKVTKPTTKPKAKEPGKDSKTGDARLLNAVLNADKEYGGRVDPLTRALETAMGDVKSETIKLEAMSRGARDIASLQQEVFQELNGKRLAGDFNEDRDKNKPVGQSDPKFLRLVQETTQKRLLAEQIKALTFAQEREAAATVEADAALDRMTSGNIEKQTDAFRALERELARIGGRIQVGTKEFKAFDDAKAAALYKQSRADSLNYAAELADKTQKVQAENQIDPRQKMMAEFEAVREAENRKFQMLMKTRADTFALSQKKFEEQINFVNADVAETEAAQAEKLEAERKYNEESELLIKQHSAFVAAESDRQRIALRTPLERLVDEWRITSDTIGQIQADAANGFVSMLTSNLGSGRMEIKNWLKAILQDIANANIKAALAAPFKDIAQGSGGFLANLFGFGGGGGSHAVGAMSAAEAGASIPVDMSFLTLFADGGIMTNYGAVELRKYANGGIANRPQLAMYGEAGPEAYVPLPDGRTIPVTLSGGGGGEAQQAPSVTVNVINQSGTAVSAQQGSPRFDGKQMILDVVLSAANSPGNFRDGMKSAMRG